MYSRTASVAKDNLFEHTQCILMSSVKNRNKKLQKEVAVYIVIQT